MTARLPQGRARHQLLAAPVRATLLALGLLAASLAFHPAAARADACTPPVTNPVACENTLPGAPPSQWQVAGDGDSDIRGFATQMSVNQGDTIGFKINSTSANYHIDIYRLGYYQGNGARLIAGNLTPTNTAAQPACKTFSDTGLIDCGNWVVSRSWTVPTTAVSGVYIAHLVRNDNGDDSQIYFVVRNDSSHSAIVLQTSDETWQAYNGYGGNSLYTCTVACPAGDPHAYKAAYKVSYNRPLNTQTDSGASALFTGAEYPMIRFLEANGYDVSYISGLDTATRPSLLLNHKLFMDSGHDEYWAGTQRANVLAARDAGVNLAFFSGNEMFWKTRLEASQDGSNTANRTLVAYKDTHFDAPTDPVEWTGSWRDPRFTDPSVNTPENALTGQIFVVNSGTSQITVPSTFKSLRMWRNTAVTSLANGTSLTLAPNTLGYEWDEDADNGYRPAGLFHLSSTTVSGLELFTDFGSSTQVGGSMTHSLTEYKAASGARVFASGTVQWAFGLDSWNPSSSPPDRNMQQATVNLLADMGAQPASLISGLVGASQTTDTTAPTATINTLPSSVADGQTVTISGTAADTGGGVVAGVEVSTDGGTTWHPATGTTSWTYTWNAHGTPSTVIKARAIDDSGNIGSAGTGTSVTVGCPCSIWGPNFTPATIDTSDPSPVEVGVKFTSDTYGSISGIRFYKATTNTGTHTGSLWSSTGTRLAQATFTNESASGWQTATFSNPVAITPGTTYVASYYAPAGHYAASSDYMYRNPAPGPVGGGVQDAAPLHALRNVGTTGNGVYSYSSVSTFPASSYRAGNYWVDVLFTPIPAPGAVTNVHAVEGGATSANVTWNAPTTGGTPASYKITTYSGSTAVATKTINGSPPGTSTTITGLTTGNTYTFTVTAINPTGNGPESGNSNSVTPTGPVVPSAPTNVAAQPASQSARITWTAPSSNGDSAITGYTITPYIGGQAQTPVVLSTTATSTIVTGLTNGSAYTFTVTARNGVGPSPESAASSPATPESTIFDFSSTAGSVDYVDNQPVELGVKFTADYSGTITGIRFYKGAGNSGTHVGSLWTSSGTRLAQATFTSESASGWQSVTFSSPVAITGGTTYVASVFSPNGAYTATAGALASPVDNPPLHAPGNSTTPNGVYAYGAASSFPASTYNAANYWVDVLYALPSPGQVTGVSATSGGTSSANLTWSAPSSGGPVTGYRITPYVNGTARAATTLNSTTTSGSVGGLTSGTTYTFTVAAINANGPGPESAQSNAVTPTSAVAPLAPTGVLARPASSSARVSWTASASNGDSPITGQTITPYIGGTAQTPTQVSASATSATVTGLTNGTSYTFKVTATNGVGTSAPSAASAAVAPEDTVLDFTSPSVSDSGDPGPLEIGMKFTTDFAGSVTGIRFYKDANNTGTHIGSLWSASGTRLAQATFSNESSSGWQSVTFSSPVAVTPGTTYVASYFAPNGHYSVNSGGFSSAVDNAPLHALDNGTSPNGVYAYGSASAFPSQTWGASNYFVDVLFQPAPAPGAPTGVTATAGQSSATVNWTAPSSGGPVSSYTITPYIGSQAQATTTVTGNPPATSKVVSGLTGGTAYTFTVTANNQTGSSPESANSNSVTPTSASVPSAPTSVAAVGDASSAIVTWSAPSSDGGSAISGYTVTPSTGGSTLTPVQTDGSATSARVTGLTNDTAYTFTVSATNGAGTGPAASAGPAVKPRASIFDSSTPSTLDSGDTSSVVLGLNFNSDVAGSITGIRFHKAAANTGTHVGALWASDGTLLASGTFTTETGSGWQAMTFANPVAINANTTYVAGYLAPNGHYSVTPAAFSSSPVTNGPLHALASPVSNGVYAYSGTMVFPTSSFNATNYWVDVLFTSGTP